MRVSVGFIRFSVRRPTGVGNADIAIDIFLITETLEVVDFPLCFINIQNRFVAVSVKQSDACAVVSAIFQTMKSFDQYFKCRPVANISYDSAHIFLNDY